MPNLDYEPDQEENFSNNDPSYENLLNSKVRKLVDDGTRVGPGSYNALDIHTKKSQAGTQWAASKTHRAEMFIKNPVNPGPGTYEIKRG